MTETAPPGWEEITFDPDGPVTKVFTVDEAEFRAAFAEVLAERGYNLDAPGFRPPTLAEARAAAAGRRAGRGWNTSPIP